MRAPALARPAMQLAWRLKNSHADQSMPTYRYPIPPQSEIRDTIESIQRDMQAVTYRALSRFQSVPSHYQSTAKDLRRGKQWVGGGFLRFLLVLSEGEPNRAEARRTALQIIRLQQKAVDAVFPVVLTDPPSFLGRRATTCAEGGSAAGGGSVTLCGSIEAERKAA